MTKFEFRLETVLKLRLAERDARREQLAEAFQAEDVLQQHQQALGTEIDEVRSRIRSSSLPGRLDVSGLLDGNRYELVLAARRQQLVQQQNQLAAEIERRRAALVEADRRVQVLEKLKEKKQVAHRQAENKQEIKLADEISQRNTVERMRRQ